MSSLNLKPEDSGISAKIAKPNAPSIQEISRHPTLQVKRSRNNLTKAEYDQALQSELEKLPPELGTRVANAMAISYRTNVALSLMHAVLNSYVLFIFPLVALLAPDLAVLSVFAVSLIFSNSHWSLLHEAIHFSLAPRDKLVFGKIPVNDLLGRFLGILFGSPLVIVRTFHLTHHAESRVNDSVELYPTNLRALAKFKFLTGYYYHLLGVLYLKEVLVPLFLLLPLSHQTLKRLGNRFNSPDMCDVAARRMLRSKCKVRQCRQDVALIVVAFATSFYLYGAYWWILAIHFLLRGFVVSFLDYSYHYETELGDPRSGNNLSLAKPISKLLLNFNYHGVHHKYPAAPWSALPIIFKNEQLVYDNTFLNAALKQLRGPMTKEKLLELLCKRSRVTP